MSSRRKHTKSRAGCDACKFARIKCDEQGPPCVSCRSRNLACEYSAKAEMARSRQHRRTPTSNNSLSPSTLATSSVCQLVDVTASTVRGVDTGLNIQQDHRLELELMNQWTAHTFQTLCHQSDPHFEQAERKLWQELMPKEALDHHYLLAALFSFTSLHLAVTAEQSLKEKYTTAAVRYHNSALKLYLETLPDVTATNCQAIYACSLAFFVMAISLPQVVPLREEPETIKDSIVSALMLYKGSKRILHMFTQQLSTSLLTIALAPKNMSLYTLHNQEFCQALDRLRALNDTCYPNQDFQLRLSNQHAIQELTTCSTRLINGVDVALIGWLMSLDEHFVNALHEQQTLPLIILLYWSILLNRPNQLWWGIRSARSLSSELIRALSGLSDQELEAVKWCSENTNCGCAGV